MNNFLSARFREPLQIMKAEPEIVRQEMAVFKESPWAIKTIVYVPIPARTLISDVSKLE